MVIACSLTLLGVSVKANLETVLNEHRAERRKLEHAAEQGQSPTFQYHANTIRIRYDMYSIRYTCTYKLTVSISRISTTK